MGASAPGLVALLAWACGGGASEGEPGAAPSRLEALELRAVGEAPQLDELLRRRRVVPEEATPWLVRGASASYELAEGSAEGADPSTPRRLVLRECNGTLLRIPLEFDAAQCNNFVLQASVRHAVTFTLEFIQKGRVLPVRASVSSEGRDGLQLLHFACPELALVEGPIAKLQLSLRGRAGQVQIEGLDLFWRAPEASLPRAAVGAELFEAGGEARRGVGLLQGVPLEARVADSRASRLAFAFCLPGYLRRGPPAPELVLTLQPDGGPAVTRRLPLDGDALDGWARATCDLDEFDAAPLTLRWSLESAGPAACLIAEPALLRRGAAPRHVLFITSDTHRADYLGAARSGVQVRTPALDALAQRGLLFTDALSPANVTNPAHIALMTGTHPRDIDIYGNIERLAEAAPTLAEAFKAAGYATYASISVRHLGPEISGLGQGFDRAAVPRSGATQDGAAAIEPIARWLAEDSDVPAFLWLHLYDAHMPYAPPPDFAGLYYPPGRDAFDASLPAPPELPAFVREEWFPGLADPAYPEALYRGEVSYLDTQLGRLLDSPALESAVIAFTADHGESLGEHGIFFDHDGLYTQSLRVPLILVFPGAAGGERSAAAVENLDLGRTLLDLAGHPGVAFPGQNLVLQAREREPVEAARFALEAHARSASITRGGWHLVFNLQATISRTRSAATVQHAVELFRLDQLPPCSQDLVEAEFETARELRVELLAWLARARDLGWRGTSSTDAATLEALEALGYTAGAEESAEGPKFYDGACTCAWCRRFE
jgi:arylsulfatase A-like enzyme